MQHGAEVPRRFNETNLGFMMIFGLFTKKNANRQIVERQYATFTASARHPALYEVCGVPDTVMGRFEMLSAMLILYFRRTRASGTSGQEIAQEIVDAFFEDVDHSIRELGVGDVGVPKRMKKFAGMFYGRLESYAAALARNFHPEATGSAPDMRPLADYLALVEADLAAQDEARVETGLLAVPDARPATAA